MSSEDISLVSKILAGVNSTDATIRTEAAKKLGELRQNLGAISFCLLQISSLQATTPEEVTVKTTALVILRKILDLEGEEKWKAIDNNLKEQIKKKALEAFVNEKDLNQKGKICDVLTQIIDKVSDCDEQWDDLQKLALTILTINIEENNLVQIDSLLKLMKDATGFLYDELFKNIKQILMYLENIFKSSFTKLKVSASELLSELISFGNEEETKQFTPFIFNILQTTLECLTTNQEDLLKRQLEMLIELVSVEPVLFRKHFNDLYILAGKIVEKKDYDEEKIREQGFEVLISLIEEKPAWIEKDDAKIQQLFEVIYKYALEFDTEPDPKWAIPEGNNFDDVESFPEEKLTQAQGLIDRLIECIGLGKTTSILSKLIQGLLGSEDWKYKYVGIYSLTCLTEYEEDMSSVEMTFPLIFSFTQSQNEKLRYAAVHFINKLSDNYNPQFQKKNIENVIPLLMELVTKETILRIQCEIVEAITSFIQFTTSEKIMPYAMKIYDLLFTMFTKDIPTILTKSILDCVLELSTTIEEQCQPIAAKAFELVLTFFSKNFEQKANRSLYGVLIECLTTIGPYTKETYYTIVPKILNCIIELVSGDDKKFEPIRDDLRNSIERLIPILQENFQNQVPLLINCVMKLITIRPKMAISSNPESDLGINEILNLEKNDGGKKNNVDLMTGEIEDLSGTLSLLKTLVETLEEQFIPYLDSVEKEILPLIKYQFSPKIRNKVAKILPAIIDILQDQNEKAVRGKRYIEAILNELHQESDKANRSKLFSHLGDVIDYSGHIFTKEEVNKLFETLLTHFESIEKERLDYENKKKNHVVHNKSPDDDEDDANIDDLLKEDLEIIEETQSEISDTIGKLFKTHKDISGDIVNVIITKILPRFASQTSSVYESKMALYIVDDMIEFLGMDMLANIWDDLYKLLISLVVNKNNQIRQAAAYGIGIFAQFTTKDFDKYAPELIKNLQNAEKITPEEEEDEEDWGIAHDNITASYGKILFYQHNSELIKKNMSDLITAWIKNLPIVYDEVEQEKQHEWLADMALLKFEMIPANCLDQTFKVLAKIYNSKSSSDATNEKIEKIFIAAKANPQIQPVIDRVYQSAENKIKKKIEKLINNNA